MTQDKAYQRLHDTVVEVFGLDPMGAIDINFAYSRLVSGWSVRFGVEHIPNRAFTSWMATFEFVKEREPGVFHPFFPPTAKIECRVLTDFAKVKTVIEAIKGGPEMAPTLSGIPGAEPLMEAMLKC